MKMKKLMVLPVAVLAYAIGSGVAVAGKPAGNMIDDRGIDRHAVWSKWYDEDGKRVSALRESMNSPTVHKKQDSSQTMSKSDKTETPRDFGFIKETEKYDYARDHGGSA